MSPLYHFGVLGHKAGGDFKQEVNYTYPRLKGCGNTGIIGGQGPRAVPVTVRASVPLDWLGPEVPGSFPSKNPAGAGSVRKTHQTDKW